jgi:hypothetical protein
MNLLAKIAAMATTVKTESENMTFPVSEAFRAWSPSTVAATVGKTTIWL